VGATIKAFVALDSMPDYLAAAMGALWSHRLNRTLKTIEDVRLARRRNLKSFVIIIAAGFTACHR
jgi:hypothetical protein